jgi:hypothetical protein
MGQPRLVPLCLDENLMPNFPEGFDQGCASHSLPEFLERRWLYDSRDVYLSQIRERHAKESSTKFFEPVRFNIDS